MKREMSNMIGIALQMTCLLFFLTMGKRADAAIIDSAHANSASARPVYFLALVYPLRRLGDGLGFGRQRERGAGAIDSPSPRQVGTWIVYKIAKVMN